jgi:hypothetical protein
MATAEARGFRRQMASKLREFEGQLLTLEGQLLILRSKAERVTGEAQTKLAALLTQAEREAAALQRAGKTALEGLGRAVEAGQGALEQVKARIQDAEALLPPMTEKGRSVLRRATIEAKAVRHGVKVGLRVARRVAKRTRAGREA